MNTLTIGKVRDLEYAAYITTTILAGDPLTAAVLSLVENRQMINELFARHKDYLPQSNVHKV